MTIRSYRDLQVWVLAMEVVEDVYRTTSNFPQHELFDLSPQLRRAAVSVPSNIAEGHSRDSSKEYLRYIAIALGPVAELETQLEIARRLKYVQAEQYEAVSAKLTAAGKMLRAIQKRCKARFLDPQSLTSSP